MYNDPNLKQVVDIGLPLEEYERNKRLWMWHLCDTSCFSSPIYTVPVAIRSDRVMPLVLACEPATSSEQISQDILSQINSIDILGVLQVDGYCQIIDRHLCTFILARDIAIGGGLSYIKTYHDRPVVSSSGDQQEFQQREIIKWERFTEYFNDAVAEITEINPDIVKFIQPLNTDGYILLETALGILNRCNNATAKKFRAELLFNAVPRIQNDTIAAFMQSIDNLGESLDQQSQQTQYYKKYTNTNQLFRSTQIAKDFGLSAKTLHTLLNYFGYIFRVNGQWVLYQPYAHLGYIVSKEGNETDTFWTHAGRAFIINTLIGYGLQLGKDNRKLVESLLDYDIPLSAAQ